MHYDGFIIRPPSEADSVILQATVGCSHNKCTFCAAYKDKRFSIKKDEIILEDIKYAAKNLSMLKRVFICDGDALIIPQKRLIWILERIREHLPWVRRVGVYSNAKSIKRKTDDELKELKSLGLGIGYLGVESGDNETLLRVNKGTTASNTILQGRRLKEAGIKVSVSVLLGIAGTKRSLIHAKATGELLSAMDPDYIGALTVMVLPGTPLFEEQERGAWTLPDTSGILKELREMILYTNLSSGLFFSNHASNYVPIKARLPKDKEKSIHLLDKAIKGEIPLKPEHMRAL